MSARGAVIPAAASVLLLAGCGGGSGDHPTQARSVARTAPAITGPASGKASGKPVAPGGKNVGRTTTYSGSGSRRLSLKLARNAVLRWKVSGTRFRLTDPSGRLKVSGGRRGQTFAPKGSYPRARVTADGRWTLRVQLLTVPQ